MKAGIGDAFATAAGAAAGGVEVAGGALAEDEAAGDAAGGLDRQACGTPAEAPLDVAEILLQDAGGHLQLAPELLKAPLPRLQKVGDALAQGRGGFRSSGIVHGGRG
jgi:hypothetical protein